MPPGVAEVRAIVTGPVGEASDHGFRIAIRTALGWYLGEPVGDDSVGNPHAEHTLRFGAWSLAGTRLLVEVIEVGRHDSHGGSGRNELTRLFVIGADRRGVPTMSDPIVIARTASEVAMTGPSGGKQGPKREVVQSRTYAIRGDQITEGSSPR